MGIIYFLTHFLKKQLSGLYPKDLGYTSLLSGVCNSENFRTLTQLFLYYRGLDYDTVDIAGINLHRNVSKRI